VSWKIGGAGVAGSYLFGRMKASGFDVEIYDPKRPNFYIPCGFATNRNSIDPYLKKLSISFDEIAEVDTGRIWISGNNFEKTEFLQNGLSTINKMKMELLMRGGMPYQRGMINDRNSVILDCTGISRAYLGKVQSDQTMFAIEKVCKSSPYDGFYFNFFRRGRGYFWSFPLGDRYHIGAGGVDLGEVRSYLAQFNGTSILSRKIRMAPTIGEIISGNVIGIGESIGYISPLLGEGIVPAIENAEKFFNIVSSTEDIHEISIKYTDSVMKRMQNFKLISTLVSNIQSGKTLTAGNIMAARHAMKELKNFGIKPDYLKILRHFL
jgi:hypothetical protein